MNNPKDRLLHSPYFLFTVGGLTEDIFSEIVTRFFSFSFINWMSFGMRMCWRTMSSKWAESVRFFFFFHSLCSETISFATHSDQSFYPIQRISARVSYVNVPHFPTGYFFFLRLPFQCLWLMERSFIIYDILTGPPGSFHFTFWRTAQHLFT